MYELLLRVPDELLLYELELPEDDRVGVEYELEDERDGVEYELVPEVDLLGVEYDPELLPVEDRLVEVGLV